MMMRVAWRSLMTRPIRAAVLAAGFGFGIAVMVELLGVGHVILEQAHAPALFGGGDLGAVGPVRTRLQRASCHLDAAPCARISPIAWRRFRRRAAKSCFSSPRAEGDCRSQRPVAFPASRNRWAIPKWPACRRGPTRAGDERWSRPEPGDVLRAMDRFHPIPDATMSSSSWAEWLYFNGRTADGRIRVYVTFLVGPRGENRGPASGQRSSAARTRRACRDICRRRGGGRSRGARERAGSRHRRAIVCASRGRPIA